MGNFHDYYSLNSFLKEKKLFEFEVFNGNTIIKKILIRNDATNYKNIELLTVLNSAKPFYSNIEEFKIEDSKDNIFLNLKEVDTISPNIEESARVSESNFSEFSLTDLDFLANNYNSDNKSKFEDIDLNCDEFIFSNGEKKITFKDFYVKIFGREPAKDLNLYKSIEREILI